MHKYQEELLVCIFKTEHVAKLGQEEAGVNRRVGGTDFLHSSLHSAMLVWTLS